MKHKMYKYLLAASTVLLLGSCGGDNTVIVDVDAEEEVHVSHSPLATKVEAFDQAASLRCVEIAYPFEMVIDGETKEVSTAEDYNAAKASYRYGIDFKYPITTSMGFTAETPLELAHAYADCLPVTGWSRHAVPFFDIDEGVSCLHSVYPLTVLSNGEEIVLQSKEDAIIANASYDDITLTYPLTLANSDNERASVYDADELYWALLACHSQQIPDIVGAIASQPLGCFDVVYPHAFVDEAGGEHMVDHKDQHYTSCLSGLLETWAYPLHIRDEVEHDVIATGDSNLSSLAGTCSASLSGDQIYQLLRCSTNVSEKGCHGLIYPTSLLDYDGLKTTLYDNQQTEQVLAAWSAHESYYDFDYPVSIVVGMDETILESYNDLIHHMITCN